MFALVWEVPDFVMDQELVYFKLFHFIPFYSKLIHFIQGILLALFIENGRSHSELEKNYPYLLLESTNPNRFDDNKKSQK